MLYVNYILIRFFLFLVYYLGIYDYNINYKIYFIYKYVVYICFYDIEFVLFNKYLWMVGWIDECIYYEWLSEE